MSVDKEFVISKICAMLYDFPLIEVNAIYSALKKLEQEENHGLFSGNINHSTKQRN